MVEHCLITKCERQRLTIPNDFIKETLHGCLNLVRNWGIKVACEVEPDVGHLAPTPRDAVPSLSSNCECEELTNDWSNEIVNFLPKAAVPPRHAARLWGSCGYFMHAVAR